MSKFKSNVLHSVINNYSILSFNVLNFILVNRFLGAEVRGQLTFLFNYSNISCILFSLGIPVALARFCSKETINIANTVKKSFILIFVTFLVGILAYIVVSQYLFTNLELQFKSMMKIIVPIYSFLLLVEMFLVAIFQGTKNIKYIKNINIIYSFILLCAVIVAVRIRFNFKVFMLITLTTLSCKILTFCYYITKKHLLNSNGVQIITYQHIIKNSYLFWFASFIQTFNYRFPAIMLGYHTSFGNVGLFATANRFIEIFFMAAKGIAFVNFVESSSLDRINRKMQFKIEKYLYIYGFIIFIIFVIFGELIFVGFFGNTFKESNKIFLILMLGGIFFNSQKVKSSEISGKGHERLNLYVSIIGLGVLLLFTKIFIFNYDVIGLTMSVAISYFTMAYCINYFFKKIFIDNDTYDGASYN